MKISSIKTPSEFSLEIEKIVKDKALDYFEAVIYYCEMNELEVETAASFVKHNQVLKSKIQVEAENLNMMKRSGRLPI